jgi:hypothetical protein
MEHLGGWRPVGATGDGRERADAIIELPEVGWRRAGVGEVGEATEVAGCEVEDSVANVADSVANVAASVANVTDSLSNVGDSPLHACGGALQA